MKTLAPETINPQVRLANYSKVKPGATWGPRAISDFELILIVGGVFSYETTDCPPITLERGDVLCIPPLENHVLQRIDEEEYAIFSCIHLEMDSDSTWLNGGYDLTPFPPRVTHVDNMARMQDHFHYCMELFEGYGRYRDALLSTMVKEIILLLAAHWETAEDRALSHRTREMIVYLRKHLFNGVTRQDLAEAFGLTPEHVNAVFKREVGVSPTEFVNRERVQRGYAMLRDHGVSVKEAAAATGFNDQFYFSKLFKRYLGLPPVQVTSPRG